MSDGFLHKYFLNNSSKRLHKWNHYFDIYERHLSRFRGKNLVMLEIGVFGGGSLDMWRAYLGTEAKIIGIDINPECKQYESDGIEIFIGSQDDSTLIDKILKKYPKVLDRPQLLAQCKKFHHHIFCLQFRRYPPQRCWMQQ